MAQHNPDEARNTVKTLLTQHDATTRISLLRVLCEQDEEGAYLALTYANSPEFTKLPHDEQQTLFRILGQTKQPAVIDFCAQLLDQKSSMLKPSIERNKRLAMLALGTARTLKAKNLLSKALQDKTNSKKLRQDIHETLKKIWT
jgi:hypothetical protein